MADITQIRAKIEVANLSEAGSDDWVYLGIAGREFVLDSGNGDDFDIGTKKVFVLGEQQEDDTEGNFTVVPVVEGEYNDPRRPQLDTDDLGLYPVYLRVEDAGSHPELCLERVRVSVYGADGSVHKFDNVRLDKVADNRRIWLHQKYGRQLYLHAVNTRGQA
ncbi:hypothetical protein ACFYXC_41275 [Streptomyces sp. NPDC002701]|uniref:hypothetical protein n=1 Tax=unclassified Streptomyces TaxID=2593676 RepID=UPI003682086D